MISSLLLHFNEFIVIYISFEIMVGSLQSVDALLHSRVIIASPPRNISTIPSLLCHHMFIIVMSSLFHHCYVITTSSFYIISSSSLLCPEFIIFISSRVHHCPLLYHRFMLSLLHACHVHVPVTVHYHWPAIAVSYRHSAIFSC